MTVKGLEDLVYINMMNHLVRSEESLFHFLNFRRKLDLTISGKASSLAKILNTLNSSLLCIFL